MFRLTIHNARLTPGWPLLPFGPTWGKLLEYLPQQMFQTVQISKLELSWETPDTNFVRAGIYKRKFLTQKTWNVPREISKQNFCKNRNILFETEIFCLKQKFSVWNRNFLFEIEIFCQNRKILSKQKISVWNRKFLSKQKSRWKRLMCKFISNSEI